MGPVKVAWSVCGEKIAYSDCFGKSGSLYREKQTSERSKLRCARSARMGIVDY